mmetsp:Transcript_8804/g.12765  ORF Transcript_8804/g.12765 Transcript_8804/m.12765 type:complete len:108 (+) Transcript_8804:113-436(+)
MTAYALLTLIFEVTQELLLLGPFEALPTLAANAVGAQNLQLAGQYYLQLSVYMYVVLGLPLFFFSFFVGTESLLLWLGWMGLAGSGTSRSESAGTNHHHGWESAGGL